MQLPELTFLSALGILWSSLLITAAPNLFQYYASCHNHSSLCFGYPKNCVDQSNCDLLFRSRFISTHQFMVEMVAPSIQPDHYAAVGFSNQSDMSGLVIQCHYSSKLSKSLIGYSFNDYKRKHNSEIQNQSQVTGFSHLQAEYENGQLYCELHIDPSGIVEYDTYRFEFNTKKYYIQLAMGKMKTEQKIGYHGKSKIVTSIAVSLNQTDTIHSKGSSTLVRLHASLMVFGWVGGVTVAILMARFSRNQWTTQTVFGVRIWFLSHRTIMMVSWLAIVASYIAIFIQYGGWTGASYHSVIGLVAGMLATLQIFTSVLRPEPNSTHRWIFDYGHWIMGNLAHMLAVTNIIKSSFKRPSSFFWLLIAYLMVYLIFSDLLRKIEQTIKQNGNKLAKKLHRNALFLVITTIIIITIFLIQILIVHG